MKSLASDRNKIQKILLHTFFWILSFYILLRIFVRGNEIESIDIIYTFLFQCTIAPFAYANLLWLKPLLDSGKWYLYGFILMLIVSAAAGFNYFFFTVGVDFVLPGYYFISYYDWIEIIQFVFGHLFILTLLQISLEWFELNRERQRISELEKEKINFEMKALLGQINPHFLFNTLNNLYSMVLNGSQQSGEYILKLADVLRYVIYQSRQEAILLEDEIRLLTDYILLQELRTDYPNAEFNVSGETGTWRIPPMIFLPLLENSFKHGIKGEKESQKIIINLQVNEREIFFKIQNEREEKETIRDKQPGGIGMENIKRRLELVFPENHEFNIEERENLFFTNLKIWKS
ncbi:MAG TPA: histidine kinase [Cyclobacteriaceae bacterium]|jgi:sensor histidine kinase YesM